MSQSKDFGEQSYRYFYSNYDKLVEQGEAFEAQSDETKLDEIVAPMETVREGVLAKLVDVLAKDPYHADQLVEQANKAINDALDMLEEKWDAFSSDTQATFLLSAENLRSKTESSFKDALTMLREDTDVNLKSALIQGFAVISDSFDFQLDDAVERFGEEMISLISAFSDEMATYAQGLEYGTEKSERELDLLNKKGIKFTEKVKELKFAFDDAIAELEEDFDEADATSKEDYDNVVDNFFATADKESSKILAMVIKKVDDYKNSFQNRFSQCDAYLEQRFEEQRELFQADAAELLAAIGAATPAPEVVEPTPPTKVMEVLDEADEPVIVREDTGAEVEHPAVTETAEQPAEDVYVPDYDGRLQIATWNMALARGFDPTVDLRL